MVRIGRFQEGICLNPLEYLLYRGKPRLFKNKTEAKAFLRKKGVTGDDLDDCFIYEKEPTCTQR
jgi:hypothetical protein